MRIELSMQFRQVSFFGLCAFPPFSHSRCDEDSINAKYTICRTHSEMLQDANQLDLLKRNGKNERHKIESNCQSTCLGGGGVRCRSGKRSDCSGTVSYEDHRNARLGGEAGGRSFVICAQFSRCDVAR